MTDLIANEGRILVQVDIEGKNWHTFSTGAIIRFERDWNNLDYKHTKQTLGIVLDGGDIPMDSLILFHHNSVHPVNEIFNHRILSGSDIASGIRLFSLPETMCYLWKTIGGEWQPMNGFATGLRVFEPIQTQFYGIAHKHLKETIFVTSGDLKGKVVHTLRASDYPIIFRNEKGSEEQIIRFRHFPEKNEREEVIAVNTDLTEKVHSGELLVGYSVTDAKKVTEWQKTA